MRNRRLLTLAVLAVAIGFSASAQADTPYGTAVLTLIMDPNSVANTYQLNIRLWADSGIGATAQTPGLADYVIKSIRSDGVGDIKPTDAYTLAPYGEVDDGNGLFYGGGFSDKGKLGIRYADNNYSGPGVPIANNYNAVGLQPVAYDSNTGPNVPLRDAGILYGVGTTGRTAGAQPQNDSIYPAGFWSTDPNTFAGDTPIVGGTYSGTTGGIAIDLDAGYAFDVLPGGPGALFAGPTIDANTFGRPVKAMVVQTTTGFGNDGGAGASVNATTFRVMMGSVTLGSGFAGGSNVSLVLDANGLQYGNTSATFAVSRTLGGLDIQKSLPGAQVVDVAAARVNVYQGTDANVTAASIRGMLGSAADGLYSSSITDANTQLVVVSAKKYIGNNSGSATTDHVEIKATMKGDITLDGVVDGYDFTVLSLNWLNAVDTGRWTVGDMTGPTGVPDGVVDGYDFTALSLRWLDIFPVAGTAPAVPEPATMSLLCLGALGLLRRRRS